jgi:hypothetical protein
MLGPNGGNHGISRHRVSTEASARYLLGQEVAPYAQTRFDSSGDRVASAPRVPQLVVGKRSEGLRASAKISIEFEQTLVAASRHKKSRSLVWSICLWYDSKVVVLFEGLGIMREH